MPIPKPKQNENKNDFISRCMANNTMVKEYSEEKQRFAICNNQFKGENMKIGEIIDFNKLNLDKKSQNDDVINDKKENMKLEIKNMKGVEIFQIGNWKGFDFTDSDLDEMIKNFENQVIEPYITIDHNEKATSQFKDALKAMSLGFVENLYKVGNKLVADFKQVPKTIAELIEAGALKKKSVELYRNFIHANGKRFKNVLQGVTFHGANGTPAITTLSDFVALYKNESILQKESNENNSEIITIDFQNIKKENKMDIIEIKKSEYDELIKMKSSNSDKDSQIENFKNKLASLTTENENLKKEKINLETFKKEVEENKKITNKKEADDYVTLKIQEGKILPKFKDKYTSDYIRCKNENENSLNLFKEDIESREKILNLGENATGNEMPDITNFKGDDPDEVQKAIDLLIKKNPGMTFKQACEKLGLKSN